MSKKNIIYFIMIICSILGLNYFVIEGNLIIFDDDGFNKTINIEDLENKTFEEISEIIIEKDETLLERLREFELRILTNCRQGRYQYQKLTVEVERVSSYDICIVTFSNEHSIINEYVYRIEKNRQLSQYIDLYEKLPELSERAYMVDETVVTEKEISMLGFRENKVLSVKQMTGPNTYLVEVEENIKKWNRYDENKLITEYYETKQKLTITEIIEILMDDICVVYQEWDEKWSVDVNPQNDYVYRKLKEVCEYEI